MQPPNQQPDQQIESPVRPAEPARKAIPPARDRLQSRLLTWIALPVLCWVDVLAVRYSLSAGHSGRIYLELSLAISLFFALFAWRVRSITAGAAVYGAMICFAITVLSGRPEGPSPFHSGLSPLLLLFALTHEATRLGRDRKAALGIAEARQGRQASQIIANLGVAAAVQGYFIWYSGVGYPELGRRWDWMFAVPQLSMPMLAALAEATADTVSSEIGKAFGGRPFVLTTLRRVPPGTDGAVSLIGTFAGIAAAALIAFCGAPALGMDPYTCKIVLLAAVGGLFFDSLLGATLERWGLIGNDAVNFSSTLFSAAVAVCFVPGQIA